MSNIPRGSIKVGEIVAYRIWHIRNNRLCSIAVPCVWEPVMSCGTGDIDSVGGLFSFKRYGDAVNVGQCIAPGAVGTIHIWGEVIEHQIGYRSEHARIIRLDKIYDNPSIGHYKDIRDLANMEMPELVPVPEDDGSSRGKWERVNALYRNAETKKIRVAIKDARMKVKEAKTLDVDRAELLRYYGLTLAYPIIKIGPPD